MAAPRPSSPSGSFYAQSDDSEGEYNTVRPQRPDRGVRLLFAKSKTYAHPTKSVKDNIPGFVVLVQEKSSSAAKNQDVVTPSKGKSKDNSALLDSLLLGWVPESTLEPDVLKAYTKVDRSVASGPSAQSFLVPALPTITSQGSTAGFGAFAIPIRQIYSLHLRPPKSWYSGSIVINPRHGDSFPALFFHDNECESTIEQRKQQTRENFDPFGEKGAVFWGGMEVLRWVKEYASVTKSAEDGIYLIDSTEEDKRSFTKPTPDKVKQLLSPESSREAGVDPVAKVFKEAKWSLLEKLSQVTTFTRRGMQAVVENKNLPPPVKRLMQNPNVQIVQDDFDSARLYLARWASSMAEQSDKERYQRMWTAQDMLRSEAGELGDFEILDLEVANLSLADKRRSVTKKEWDGFFNSTNGRLQVTVDEVKERIFHGGLDPDDGVRAEAWLFLLGVYEWDSSKEDRVVHMNSMRDEYLRLKGAWWERIFTAEGTLEEREWWQDQKLRIGKHLLTCHKFQTDSTPLLGIRHVEKDVHRTDRHIPLFEGEDIPHPDPTSPFAESGTNVHLEQMKDMLLTYDEYNRDLGYVQGMSDLLAPLYAVTQDDAVAFWAFTRFMDRMERNFLRDQSGMRLQLLSLDHLVQLLDPKLYTALQAADSTNFFFFFRMLLVWYKREFEFGTVLRLWEGLWTDYLSSNFHLFVAMAILDEERTWIMESRRGFDEVLKHFNELSGKIDLERMLMKAEVLFRRFQKTIEALDRQWNFPAAPIRRKSGEPPVKEQRTAAETEEMKDRVISPELRALLSREVKILDKKKAVQAETTPGPA